MRNNKGLTLVELIAVLAVLAVISLIIVPVVFDQIKEYRDQIYDDQISIIVDAARAWATDHTELLPNVKGESYYITVEQLQDGGYLDADFKNAITKVPFAATSYVSIECILSTETNYDYSYTYIS